MTQRVGLAVVTESTPEAKKDAGTAFQRIASVDELEPYGQFSRWVDDHDILVFRKNGEIKALSNICPHFGGPVGYHQMREGVFTCLWHNYRFDAESGQCLSRQNLCLRSYKVKVEDGGIWVQLVESENEE
ncbi:MAG: Rieske (2Fe-2S) protein [Myxococcales bacterium]|nr:Rieske (2Fe-2S) protein [Myxococcales bacterium]